MTSDVVSVSKDSTIAEVRALFEQRGISAVPVLDSDGRPKGILSKTDLVRNADEDIPREDDDLPVDSLMTHGVYSFTASTPVGDAIAAMGFEGIQHLPVVSESGEVIGVLTSLDVLRWLAIELGYKPATDRGRAFER